MSLFDIFRGYTKTSSTEEKTPPPLSVKEGLLMPALHIITKSKQEPEQAPLKRLTAIEKQELIEQHSVLEKSPGKQPLPNAEVLGQIHADALIGGTSFENLPATAAIKTWRGLLDEVKEVTVPQELKSALAQYEKCATTIESLKEQEEREFFLLSKMFLYSHERYRTKT